MNSLFNSGVGIDKIDEIRCCRVCLSMGHQNELEDYIDLLERDAAAGGDHTLLESLNKCTQLHIVVTDFYVEGYPPYRYMCGRCRLDLKQAYEFIIRAQLNHQLLKGKTMLLKKGIMVNDSQNIKSDELENGIMEEEFNNKELSDGEHGYQIPNITNEFNDMYGDTNSEMYEAMPTTLVSVERVFCTTQDEVQNNIHNEIQQLSDNEETKSSYSKFSKSEAEETNIYGIYKKSFDFKCEFCTSIFEFQRDLFQHYEVDHGDKTLNFPCEYCENLFITKNALRLHRRQVHHKDEYTDCKHCGRAVLKTFYNMHLRRHKQLKFLCSKCPKICASRYTLKKHMDLHSDERDRNIECIDCGRRFYNLDSLQLHQTTHISPEDRAVFECTVCPKTFLRKSNLGLHMQMHRGKTMDCAHCGKKFVRRKDLEVHIRFHTGDFPYACTMCDRKFAIKGHLNYHEKRHLGVRYKCDECEKTFINLAGLRQHQYEHTGMPLVCAVCQRGFPTKFKVRRHLRTVHQSLFKKTGFTDALLKKYITSPPNINLGKKKSAKLEEVIADSVEMLEEHVEDIP